MSKIILKHQIEMNLLQNIPKRWPNKFVFDLLENEVRKQLKTPIITYNHSINSPPNMIILRLSDDRGRLAQQANEPHNIYYICLCLFAVLFFHLFVNFVHKSLALIFLFSFKYLEQLIRFVRFPSQHHKLYQFVVAYGDCKQFIRVTQESFADK